MEEYVIKERVVGVDISYDKTSYSIIDVRGHIIAVDSFVTSAYPNVSDYVSVLCDHIFSLIEANGGYESVRSVGISVSSGNFLTGCIENATNMPWKGVIPLAAMVRDRLGLAVALGNDCHASCLGEQVFGSAHGMKDFAVVNIGHGLGNSIYSDGTVHLGANGFANELGHTCLIDKGRPCACGLKGCLETYVSEKGILQTARELMEESSEPTLMRDCKKLSPKEICKFCEQGDALAIEVMNRTGYYLGIGLANIATTLDLEAIILTGGISRSGKWLLDPTNESFRSHLFHNVRDRVKLICSKIDDRERDMLGASVLAWKVKEYSLFK